MKMMTMIVLVTIMTMIATMMMMMMIMMMMMMLVMLTLMIMAASGAPRVEELPAGEELLSSVDTRTVLRVMLPRCWAGRLPKLPGTKVQRRLLAAKRR